MNPSTNPFHELYVSETIAPEEFVQLFSPFLVDHARELFQVGNVVVKGVQGCGKSMLLSLLKPEIQIAYQKAKRDFPIPGSEGHFLGAGINLTRSAATEFSQRRLRTSPGDEAPEEESETLTTFFGDFLNYWITEDLLRTVEMLSSASEGKIAQLWSLEAAPEKLDQFATWLARQDCWFGYFPGVATLSQLRKAIRGRISTYRSFLNFNIDSLPEGIARTKTPIGEPISQVARGLHLHEIIPKKMPVFVRIDQYEEVGRFSHSKQRSDSISLSFRRLINKALATRDPRVSYRIGTRRYGWQEDLRIFGSQATLEHERNYVVVDLDELLRRKENPRTWIFPDFADDILRRRLEFAGYHLKSGLSRISRSVFGRTPTPEKEAKVHAGKAPAKILKPDSTWPKTWVELLENIAEESPLSAKLGEAWLRQSGGQRPFRLAPSSPPLGRKSLLAGGAKSGRTKLSCK